ncbi:MAG: hypothetical protein CMH54_02270 [Myxococcales bacterium]|nr:hypothetical protein [Myxococcales bacterium]|tara:strand:+ start:537 stop:1163 length:627 start_codon:yes stop_codon:yes gene_type:complete
MASVLYLTGFGAFPGVDRNLTGEVASHFNNRKFGKLTVVSDVLPVSYERSAAQVEEGIREHNPRIIVEMGLVALDSVLRLETWAVNEMTGRLPDCDGFQPREVPIDENKEFKSIYQTSMNVGPVLEEYRRSGFPGRISCNAGRYVCNSVYYRTLAQLAESNSKTPAVFLHLPMVGLRPFGDQRYEPWDLERLTLASEAMLSSIVKVHG